MWNEDHPGTGCCPVGLPYGGSSGEIRGRRIQKAWRRKRLISNQYTTTAPVRKLPVI